MKHSRLVQIAADTVGAAQRQLPLVLRPIARGVPVHYEARPDASLIADGFDPGILGLFTGNPHGTELSQDNPAPAQILLYLANLWEFAEEDVEVFRDEVRTTYLHEFGHYLGWDEQDLAARGLD